MAEGMRYRAIAPLLEIPVNEARKAARGCEAKRERFQLLYDTGRLCGFRSQTILALQRGAAVSEELAQRAFAHLEGCAHCRSEHKTNARRLRRSFQNQAAGLLPIPLLAGRLGWLARLELRARAIAQRAAPYGSPPSGGGVRERAIAIVASGGAAAKLAAAGATVAVIAGGAIGASSTLEHPTRHDKRANAAHRSARASTPTPAALASTAQYAPPAQHAGRAESTSAQAHPSTGTTSGQRREPGGFAYLGVPSASASAGSAPSRARSASAGSAPAAHARPDAKPEQRGGGPFSP